MEFILIIIVVIVISVISASVKKKPQSSQKPDDEPPRPTMSDIQRAFMMATGAFEEDEDTAPPPAARPVSAPADDTMRTMQSRELGSRLDEGLSAEGRLDEGPPQVYDDNALFMPRAASSSAAASPFANVRIGTYFMDEESTETSVEKASLPQQTQTPRLTLFENQSDVVKALIYSEILPRRRRRARL